MNINFFQFAARIFNFPIGFCFILIICNSNHIFSLENVFFPPSYEGWFTPYNALILLE